MNKSIYVLLFVAVFCLSISVAHAAYEPTGDALYDRYAQAVLAQPTWPPDPVALKMCEAWPELAQAYVNPLTLPNETLAQWEGEFGGDPRYWQLRAYCHAFRHCRALNHDDEPDLVGGAAILREGWERGGAVDAETLLLTHLWEGWATGKPIERVPEQVMREELIKHYHVEGFWATTTVEQMEEMLKDIDLDIPDYSELAQRFEQEELELLSAAIEMGPDECWPYWRRAIYWLSYGEPELGLADLEAGNAASVCSYPMCFPVSFVYDELAAGRVAGDKALSGLLIEEAAHYSTLHNGRDTIMLRERHKEAEVVCNLSGDYSVLAALFETAVRLGLAERRSIYTSYEATNQCSIPANHLFYEGVVEPGTPGFQALRKAGNTRRYATQDLYRYQFKRAFADLGLTVFYIDHAEFSDFFNELYLSVTIGLNPYEALPQPVETPDLLSEKEALWDPLMRGPRFWDAWRADYEFVERNFDWMFTVLAQYDMHTLTAPESQRWSHPYWY